MENKEEIVRELNCMLQDKGEQEFTFSWASNGFTEVIFFEEYLLWSDDCDERLYIDNGNTKEDLTEFLKKKFNAIIDRLNKLRF